MSPFRGKILVVRGGAIGDFILTLPALAALRQQFPDCRLEVLGYPHIVPLAEQAGLVHGARSIEARALAGFFARHGELDESLADYFSDFDLIISYLYDPDEIFKENVEKCATGQFIAGPYRPDESLALPAASVFLKPLERLAIFEADAVPRLSLGKTGSRPASLALHPGSGSESKNWLEEKWAELLGRLMKETSLQVLVVGGEAELDRVARLARGLIPSRFEVAQSLPLTELGRRLEMCAAFLGHDSGISHLAAALGLPCILLWGDSSEAVWRPPSDRVRVLRSAAGLSELEVGGVFETVIRMLGVPALQP